MGNAVSAVQQQLGAAPTRGAAAALLLLLLLLRRYPRRPAAVLRWLALSVVNCVIPVPSTRFSPEDAPRPPDYDDPSLAAWAAHPGKESEGELVPEGE